jgi:hypothetical protein
MTTKDEIAALRREVKELKAEVEARNKPPAPFKDDWQPFDPTANMRMPPSAMRDLVAGVPDGVMGDIRSDRAVPSGPRSMVPEKFSEGERRQPPKAWEIPYGPQPGINLVDQQCDAQDRSDRVELAQRLARQRLAEGRDG